MVRSRQNCLRLLSGSLSPCSHRASFALNRGRGAPGVSMEKAGADLATFD